MAMSFEDDLARVLRDHPAWHAAEEAAGHEYAFLAAGVRLSRAQGRGSKQLIGLDIMGARRHCTHKDFWDATEATEQTQEALHAAARRGLAYLATCCDSHGIVYRSRP